MKSRSLVLAADHAGYKLKEDLKSWAAQNGWDVMDLGPSSEERTDYPDYADKLCQELMKDPDSKWGLLICGSGQGMAIRANRYSRIRAALCWNTEVAQLSRQHNNANVLCLGSRFVDLEEAKKIWDTFSTTDFEGGRHEARVDKLSKSPSTTS